MPKVVGPLHNLPPQQLVVVQHLHVGLHLERFFFVSIFVISRSDRHYSIGGVDTTMDGL